VTPTSRGSGKRTSIQSHWSRGNASDDPIRAFKPENERHQQIKNWVRLAIRIFQGPDGDTENKNKAAEILKTAVPALGKIRDEHQSERLRNTAAKYLEQIAREVG